MNDQNNNEQLESLEPVGETQPKNYEAEVNNLLNSVTMADLVDPSVVKKKKKKKNIIIISVCVLLIVSSVGVVMLSRGSLSNVIGPKTTNELDVFKTETTNPTIESNSDVGKYTRSVNTYTLDVSNAENGKTIKYYLTSSVTLYITYADDYDTSHKFTININNSNYKLEQDKMGTLTLNVSSDYLVYSNSEYPDQTVLSKNGLLFEEDTSINTSDIVVTTTTTTTTVPTVIKTFNFPNTRDANGRTTYIETVYDARYPDIDFIYVDEDGVAHVVFIGTEESRRLHPELYADEVPEETSE